MDAFRFQTRLGIVLIACAPMAKAAEKSEAEAPIAEVMVTGQYIHTSRKNATLYPEDLDGEGAFDPISLFTLPSYSIVDAASTASRQASRAIGS